MGWEKNELPKNAWVKKSSILLVPVAKIGDLGVAKIIKADSRRTQSVITKIPGTQDFMPSECFGDKSILFLSILKQDCINACRT